MDLTSVLAFASSSGTVTSTASGRPFFATFLLTALGRLIHEAHTNIAAIQEYPFIAVFSNVHTLDLPLWMISDMFLAVFGLLALVEAHCEQDHDLRPVLGGLKKHLLTPAVGVLLHFGLAQGQAADIVEVLTAHLPAQTLNWLAYLGPVPATASTAAAHTPALSESLGWLVTGISLVWAVLMAFATWMVGVFRQGLVDLLEQIDGSGHLGLMNMFGLAEGSATLGLIVLLVFLPLAALALAGLALVSLFLLRKWFEWCEMGSKVPCGSCGATIFPSALFCQVCRQPNWRPVQLGVFGQPKGAQAADRTAHRLNLLACKRCPFCATRLTARAVSQTCTACGCVTFATISEANVYLRALDQRLLVTLLICGALGVVPVLGAGLGMWYYQLSLVGSLCAYIPRSIGCVTRWGVGLGTVVLLALQPFFVGWLTVPLMALLNYWVYRQVLRAQMDALPQGGPQGVASHGDAVVVGVGRAGSSAQLLAHAQPPPTSPPAAQQRACGACGAANAAGHRFCSRCGSALGGTSGSR